MPRPGGGVRPGRDSERRLGVAPQPVPGPLRPGARHPTREVGSRIDACGGSGRAGTSRRCRGIAGWRKVAGRGRFAAPSTGSSAAAPAHRRGRSREHRQLPVRGRIRGARQSARHGTRGRDREVTEANLLGRGGAAFLTGRKWDAVAKAANTTSPPRLQRGRIRAGTFRTASSWRAIRSRSSKGWPSRRPRLGVSTATCTSARNIRSRAGA